MGRNQSCSQKDKGTAKHSTAQQITFFLKTTFSKQMGNDGGSIPKRIELVKEKKKAAVQNPDIERRAVWFFCALSKVKKTPPLIMP
jgi:hypothetical protein